jgi:hypothetical protein
VLARRELHKTGKKNEHRVHRGWSTEGHREESEINAETLRGITKVIEQPKNP